MKRKLMVVGYVAMILSIALLLQGKGSTRLARVTEPEAEMTDLKNLDQLKEMFQRDRGMVRLVTLLSPV